MKIQFSGAARTVTGSKHLVITAKGKKILLDCGLYQGHGADTDKMNRTFDFDPAEISAVILSHAHIDHSGNIPGLVKQGFKGPVYCTPATYELCEIMLADSAHIHENDIAYINKRRALKKRAPLKPLYTIDDVNNSLKLFNTIKYNKPFPVNDEVTLTFTDAGHILGSAAINLQVKEKNKTLSLSFTGDIGRPNDQILKAPEPFPQADYIIAESTYGNRLHEDTSGSEKKLLDVVINTCLVKKGKLIIPAFSLGRTQEIVYALDKMKTRGVLPPVKVFVDSPLAIDATDIMRRHTLSFNDEVARYIKKDPDPFGFSTLRYIRERADSMALNHLKEPCIIISASGMMEAGRVKHHVKNNIGDIKNTLLIVGFCSSRSLGGRLARGEKNVTIFGDPYEVKADVEIISSYSAHADYKEMIEYLSCQDTSKVTKVFLVHGEYEVQSEYKDKLMLAGFRDIEIPAQGDIFTSGI